MSAVRDTAPATPLQRVGNVVKLHFVNPMSTIGMPWMILALIFLVNLAIWWIIYLAVPVDHRVDAAEGLQYSGASFFIFVYMMVVAIMAISVTFPFALGYGVTRRDYYLGSSVAFVLLSAMYAAGLTILSVIEELTNGWGLGGRMFTAVYFGDGGWPERLFIFFVSFLFFFFIGAVFGAVYVRWKATGVTLMCAILAVLLVGGAALITFTGNWIAVGEFFVSLGFLGAFALSLVATVIFWLAGFRILRKATPRAA